MALRQEAVGIKLGATSIGIRSRVFQAVNLAILGRRKEPSRVRRLPQEAEASRDDGVIAFTKAVYAWLLREHRYEKQRLKKSTLDTNANNNCETYAVTPEELRHCGINNTDC